MKGAKTHAAAARVLIVALGISTCGCGWLDEPIVDSNQDEPGEVSPGDTGTEAELVGHFELIYYWRVKESDYPGDKTVEILSAHEEVLAVVSQDFADELTMEGTGLLEDGRLLGLDVPCEHSPTEWCYQELDLELCPYGKGTKGPLRPFRTVAVAGFWEAFEGDVWYVPELDGLTVPGPAGNLVHDGCVVVGDTGWSLTKQRLDLFIYEEAFFLTAEIQLASESKVEARVDSNKCPVSAKNVSDFWPLPPPS